MFGPVFRWTFVGLLAAFAASFFASYDPRATSALAVTVAIAACALALRRLDLALLVVIAELVAGSLGHLFELHVGTREIPVRMLLFSAVLLAHALRFRFKPFRFIDNQSKIVAVLFLLLLAVVGAQVIASVARGTALIDVFNDANAYAYLLLFFPLRHAAQTYPRFRAHVISVICAGALATAVLTVLITLAYRFELGMIRDVYVWIRDYGLGEVTPPEPVAWNRVFFQSHLWVLLALPLIKNWAVAGSMLALIVLSFSRSLWLGAAAAFPLAPRPFIKALPIAALIILLVAPASLGLARGRTNIRTEPAAASRWALLPVIWESIKKQPILGYGFGATLTYETADPKLIREFGTSQFTTYAFEWGYLEQWFKMGVFGLAAILAVLLALGRKIWLCKRPLGAGLLAGLAAVGVAHIFSPYLNHPLGLGFLMIAYILSEGDSVVSA